MDDDLNRKIFGAVGLFMILGGAKILSDGDSSGGWIAIIMGAAILLHVAFSKKL